MSARSRPDPSPLRRVMVVGQPGSGKSTFARMLGAATGLPVVHIDHIHWMDGWVEREAAEKDRLTREVHARDAWIFEGGHSRTWPERLARADTLVWIDVGLALRTWRVLRRVATGYGRARPDMPAGCPERIDGVPCLPRLHLAHPAERAGADRRDLRRPAAASRAPSRDDAGRGAGPRRGAQRSESCQRGLIHGRRSAGGRRRPRM